MMSLELSSIYQQAKQRRHTVLVHIHGYRVRPCILISIFMILNPMLQIVSFALTKGQCPVFEPPTRTTTIPSLAHRLGQVEVGI